jgi:CubicO group peptidase (beta-lactamase class C family)
VDDTPDPVALDDLLADWPNPALASIGLLDRRGRVLGRAGDTGRVSRVASVGKLVVGVTMLVAVEEGTVRLDDPAGPPGATLRHLLAHAGGYAFDTSEVQAEPGSRRIYSNTGIEVAADHLAVAAGMPYEHYQREAVLDPLGMTSTFLDGSPAHGLHSCVDDLLALADQLLRPTLIDRSTLDAATVVHFPDLRGVLPGFGLHDPNPWGLTFEIRGHKHPHWTAPGSDPRTFGHFGGAGTYLWVDPGAGLAAAAISGTDFGPWAADAWPVTNQALLDRATADGVPTDRA